MASPILDNPKNIQVVRTMILKEAFPLHQSSIFNRKKLTKRRLNLNAAGLLRELALIPFCFLIGRAVMFNEMAPFGAALFAVLLNKRMGGFSAFIAICAGLFSCSLDAFSLKYAGVMIIVALVGTVFPRKRRSLSFVSVTVFLSLMAINALYAAFNSFLAYELLTGFFESITGFIMVYIFSIAADVMKEQKRRRVLSGEEIICLSIVLSLTIIGFWNITILGISLRNVAAVFLILLMAAIGGAGVGSAMGITVGFVLSLSTFPDPSLLGVLAVCGLMAGTFKGLGRFGSIMAFALANALMTFYINQSTYVILPFVEIAAASLFVMVLPPKAIRYLKQFLDHSFLRMRDQQHYVKRMQELTVGRLNEFSQVFYHLSKAFGRISEHKHATCQEEISALFDQVAVRVCKGCALYRSCWHRDFYNTYSAMFDMLTLCETQGDISIGDMPGWLRKRCLNPESLPYVLKNVYTTYCSDLRWRRQLDDCRQLVAEQLEGVSRVVTRLASELDMDVRFKKDLEETIYMELDKRGIRVRDSLALEKPGGKLEISISKACCSGRRECTEQVEKVVTEIVGKPMNCINRECISNGRDHCVLRLVEARQFEVITGVARKAGEDNAACGDSYSFTPVKDGRYLLALSDGMGTGARAAEESSAVISLLENFLEAGFDQDITINTINSILMLRSREEIFATADICVLDLVNCHADFIKIGAVSTFIRRGDNVITIQEATLPIGILDEVEPNKITVPIQDEDMLIMVTDGVFDAFGTTKYIL
jgi:stage II sporulation protein E